MKAPIFGRPGLSEEKFHHVLDTYLETGILRADDYALMNKDQENIIREVRKSIKRITTKNKQQIYESTTPKGI